MGFHDKMAWFIGYIAMTVCALGLYVLWFHIIRIVERNELLREILEANKAALAAAK